MNQFVYGISVALILGTAVGAEEKTISLNQVWAYNMPGTRPMVIRGHEEESHLLTEILRALATPPVPDGAQPAFAVLGTDMEALREARAVLVEGKKPNLEFPAGRDITIVFFSYQLGSYVHIQEVQLRDNKLEVQYRFVPHRNREVTAHFALIPLGKLPPGKYSVEIQQQEHAGITRGPEHWERRVSKSFNFSVEDHHKEQE